MNLSLLTLTHVIVLLAVSLRLFSRRSLHGTALAWLLLIILIPALGVLVYLLIGERRLGKTWMRRAIALQPQILRWAQRIPATNVVSPMMCRMWCCHIMGKSAIHLARVCGVSTRGTSSARVPGQEGTLSRPLVETKRLIREDIRDQEQDDKQLDQLSL